MCFSVCKKRRTVWRWYEKGKKYPSVFPKASESYFMRVWEQHHSDDIKCRKYVRFTKCDVCVGLRATKNDRSKSSREPAAAEAKLEKHYEFVRAERAAHQA